MVSKERQRTAKLTRAQVKAIRERYAAGGITQLALAREYGVTGESINNIVRRRTWVAKAA
jgi:plasmid maintenance system antidote protein VapI